MGFRARRPRNGHAGSRRKLTGAKNSIIRLGAEYSRAIYCVIYRARLSIIVLLYSLSNVARPISLSILIVTPDIIILVSLALLAILPILVSKPDLQTGYVRETRLTTKAILSKMKSTTGMARKTRLTRMVILGRLRRLIRG